MSELLVNAEGGLTAAGYAVTIIAGIILFLAAVYFAAKTSSKKRMSTKQLVFCAVALALAYLTSYIKLFEMPWGGSVTLFSMLFASLAGYFYGPATGILTGAAYGILQLIIEPYIYFPIQVLVDYPLAFGALGLSGFFCNAKHGLIKGYVAGILGRYVFAVLSGWLFFGAYAWEGWDPLPYSLVYNGIYIFAEGILTVIILLIPAVSKGIKRMKVLANS